jgi:hypothetical protein
MGFVSNVILIHSWFYRYDREYLQYNITIPAEAGIQPSSIFPFFIPVYAEIFKYN